MILKMRCFVFFASQRLFFILVSALWRISHRMHNYFLLAAITNVYLAAGAAETVTTASL